MCWPHLWRAAQVPLVFPQCSNRTAGSCGSGSFIKGHRDLMHHCHPAFTVAWWANAVHRLMEVFCLSCFVPVEMFWEQTVSGNQWSVSIFHWIFITNLPWLFLFEMRRLHTDTYLHGVKLLLPWLQSQLCLMPWAMDSFHICIYVTEWFCDYFSISLNAYIF